MWLDSKQTQHARAAFDVNSSLISIEATDETLDILASVARRIRRQMRAPDSVLLLSTTCVLLLPATPFSGAQALARRIAPLLSECSCELHVYHGTTALLLLQRLREALDDQPAPTLPYVEQEHPVAPGERAAPLPYLAFLADYPSPRLLHLFPYELACRYQCVPVGGERKMLTLATCHWLNRDVVMQLHAITRREIFQVRCDRSIIDEVLRYWQRISGLNARESFEARTDKLCNSAR